MHMPSPLHDSSSRNDASMPPYDLGELDFYSLLVGSWSVLLLPVSRVWVRAAATACCTFVEVESAVEATATVCHSGVVDGVAVVGAHAGGLAGGLRQVLLEHVEDPVVRVTDASFSAEPRTRVIGDR